MAEGMYEDVIWKARTPNPGPYSVGEENPSVNVEYYPRCPKCKTKLEQNDSFFWYNWSCVRCDFKKRTSIAFEKVRNS